jgi:hypothetical protein
MTDMSMSIEEGCSEFEQYNPSSDYLVFDLPPEAFYRTRRVWDSP